VWSAFDADTDYFGRRDQAWMVNFRVHDLDAMLAQLRDAGVEVDDRLEEYDYGRFGWARDPEGNRFELWDAAGNGLRRSPSSNDHEPHGLALLAWSTPLVASDSTRNAAPLSSCGAGSNAGGQRASSLRRMPWAAGRADRRRVDVADDIADGSVVEAHDQRRRAVDSSAARRKGLDARRASAVAGSCTDYVAS
jgi:hypothetical protein